MLVDNYLLGIAIDQLNRRLVANCIPASIDGAIIRNMIPENSEDLPVRSGPLETSEHERSCT